MKAFTNGPRLLLAALLLGAGLAHADPIPFSYSWDISPKPPVYPSGTGSVALVLAGSGSSSVTLGGGAATVLGASVSTTSSATDGVSDHYDVAFTLMLHLTDDLSGQSKDFSFAGTLKGDVTVDGSTLVAAFGSPVTQEETLGGRLYTVSLSPLPLDIPAPTGPQVDINALVQIGEGQTTPPVSETPEPASLLLGGLALPLLAAARAWRRRQDAA